ncbi:pseudouridine synthase [Bengtsoniella intestinalis]|uniref:pseudouridine synthase n=1 Tax=Bengtsoniella intestinalis TaxID=3073143 RepID=UPI00391F77BA
MEQRLQKILSGAGICSRRMAETYITDGRVTVNGVLAELGQRADDETDEIAVDGTPIGGKAAPIYGMLNKPRGYVTTLSDEQGRRTIADLLSEVGSRVYPVGRLDMDSEGLLLFTNDGEFMQSMLHPKFEVDKVYHVWVEDLAPNAVAQAVERLSAMTDLEGEEIVPAQVFKIQPNVLQITIHQGKNRQIRRMCTACDLKVMRLRRVAEHHVQLGTLRSGTWRYLTQAEVDSLKND